MNILHLDSSILGDNSASRQLTAETVAHFRAGHPDAHVDYRDLAATPLTHLSGAVLGGSESELGEAILAEFLAADVVVVGAPMYNFGVPSQLKAWIDRVCVAGRTFKYTENGPVGLAGGKKVIIVSSRGGAYIGGGEAYDHQEAHLTTLFGFLGVTDVSVVRAEGLAMGDEARNKAFDSARSAIATA
jgi:FMN-dependent NADH-azoreductase